MSDRTDEISLWNHKFVLVWLFLHFFISVALKAHLQSVRFSLVPLDCSVKFSSRLCPGYRKNRRFGSGSANVKRIQKFSELKVAIPRGF